MALRGFVVQTLVAILESLDPKSKWTELRLEPDVGSEKIDLLWTFPGGRRRAVQVKSTANQFTLSAVQAWAQELVGWEQTRLPSATRRRPPVEYLLFLVGDADRAVQRLKSLPVGGPPAKLVQHVQVQRIPCNPDRPGDLAHLYHSGCHLLSKFLSPARVGPDQLEEVIQRLQALLQNETLWNRPMQRDELRKTLIAWVRPRAATSATKPAASDSRRLAPGIRWVAATLENVHRERLASARQELVESPSPPLTEAQLIQLARADRQDALTPDLPRLLQEGAKRREFWAERIAPLDAGGEFRWVAYHRPGRSEVARYIADLKRRVLILFPHCPSAATDAASVLSGLDAGGLAAHAEALLRVPPAAFPEVLWPEVSRFLRAERHGYRHSTGTILIARDESAAAVVRRLLRDYLDDDPLPNPICRDWSASPFTHPELLGNLTDGRPTTNDLNEALAALFTMKVSGLDPAAKDRFAELRLAYSREQGASAAAYFDTLNLTVSTAIARASRLKFAEFFALGLTQVW